MKFLSFIVILFLLTSCQQDLSSYYSNLNIRQCDSLLNRTALSSRERAMVVMQYALLNTQQRRPLGGITSSYQDTCLNLLREVIAIAPSDLQTELKITILPFYLSKLTLHNTNTNRIVRKIMSEIENSSLTKEQEAWYLNYKAQFYTIQRAPQKAFQLCEKARTKFRLNDNKQGEYNTLTQMVRLYLLLKDYTTALRYCDSARLLEGYTPPLPVQQQLQSQYSILYANTGQFDKAIKARRKSGSDTIRNSALVNLYIAAKQYDKALNIIEKQKQQAEDNSYLHNYYLRSKAEVYEAAGQFEKAAIYREKAIDMAEANSIEIRKKYPELPGIPVAFASIYASQAAWNWNKGDQKKAIQLLCKAELLTLRSKKIQKENIQLLKQLTGYYQEMGDFHSALATNLRCDSLENLWRLENSLQDYQPLLFEQEIEIFNATIDKQKAELRTIRYTYIFSILSMILIICSIVLSIPYYKKFRNKKNKHTT